MIKKRIKKTLLFIIATLFLFQVNVVYALEVNYPSLFGLSLNDNSGFPEYAKYFFNVGIILSCFVAAISIAFGGVYYLVSYGRGKFTTEAKEWIKSGLLGLLIVVSTYLIAYTINPELVLFKLPGIPQLFFNQMSNEGDDLRGGGVSYQEIPIGNLTENLLSRTLDCYDFDAEGNPIEGVKMTIDIGEKISAPTYMNHDRVDCALKLADATQKKAFIVSELSKKITDLMNQCDCEKFGACSDTCNGAEGCDKPAVCPPVVPEDRICAGDCVDKECVQKANTSDCCPAGIKEKIEHGEIEITVGGIAKKYKGLDELRCDDEKLEIQKCNGFIDFLEKEVEVNKIKIKIIDKEKWKKLNLMQQMIYYKEKIEKIEKSIKADKNELISAKDALGNCYLAISSVDLLKEAKKESPAKPIKINRPFSDPETNSSIKISNYCEGFNYNNSSCLKICNEMCPDTSNQAIDLYRTKPIAEAYMKRECKSAVNDFGDFESCLDVCRTDCKGLCQQKYPDGKERELCEDQCAENSKCVIENADKCLFNDEKIKKCANNLSDKGNYKKCIDNAYLCKNGSDQYAGYPDCSIPFDDIAFAGKCSKENSASFFYKNPECLKCEKPNLFTILNPTSTCQELYPEVSKCPASSDCPTCPCDKIVNKIINIPSSEEYNPIFKEITEYQIVGPECNSITYSDDPLTFYCRSDWWDDKNKEGDNEKPLGNSRVCKKMNEIPVGETVDTSLAWSNKIIGEIQESAKITDEMLLAMNKAGKAKDDPVVKNYCKCGAKLENNKPICKTTCEYSNWQERVPRVDIRRNPVLDENGDPIIDIVDRCECVFQPCTGKPCEQEVIYLSQLPANYARLRINFINFYLKNLVEPRSDSLKTLDYSRKKTNSCSVVTNLFDSETRMLSCSRVKDELSSPITGDKITLFEKNIDSYCYGKDLGDLFGLSYMDNWFCCEEYGE